MFSLEKERITSHFRAEIGKYDPVKWTQQEKSSGFNSRGVRTSMDGFVLRITTDPIFGALLCERSHLLSSRTQERFLVQVSYSFRLFLILKFLNYYSGFVDSNPELSEIKFAYCLTCFFLGKKGSNKHSYLEKLTQARRKNRAIGSINLNKCHRHIWIAQLVPSLSDKHSHRHVRNAVLHALLSKSE